MIAVIPVYDAKPHDICSSACACGCDMSINDDGDLVILHNLFDPNRKTGWAVLYDPENFYYTDLAE